MRKTDTYGAKKLWLIVCTRGRLDTRAVGHRATVRLNICGGRIIGLRLGSWTAKQLSG